MADLYQQFRLTLLVNHACNLRCDYCYGGSRQDRPMPAEVGAAALARAWRSLAPGGVLNLGFFGGEPLLEAPQILRWMASAREHAQACGKIARFNLSTNGTVANPQAWQIMMDPELELGISFDGHPRIHDRHRRDVHGRGSAAVVEQTLRQLLRAGKPFHTLMVVRPDNLEELPECLTYLYDLGIREVDLSLDLWTTWNADDGRRLEAAIHAAAELWCKWLPDFGLSWFDTKVGHLAGLRKTSVAPQCGFGAGELVVAPSGRLYPCERLVGDDSPDSPMRLPGQVLDGEDFLSYAPPPFAPCTACSHCELTTACDTICRCSNYVRTGDVNRPDGLLCILNKATAEAACKVLRMEAEN